MEIKLAIFFAVLCSANGQYVWDLLKPAMTSQEIIDLLSNSVAGQSYPIMAEIPQNTFDCASQKSPGFYADVSTQCQVFHRCDLNGNMTSYLCTNMTVFNQITLVCDYFFNVDCQGFAQHADFANSRLYSDKPLFDTPPADYVAPMSSGMQAMMGGAGAAPAPKVSPPKPAGKSPAPAPKSPSMKAGGMAVTSTKPGQPAAASAQASSAAKSAATTKPAPAAPTTKPAAAAPTTKPAPAAPTTKPAPATKPAAPSAGKAAPAPKAPAPAPKGKAPAPAPMTTMATTAAPETTQEQEVTTAAPEVTPEVTSAAPAEEGAETEATPAPAEGGGESSE